MSKLAPLLQAVYLAHKLKTEGRHCWHEGGRRESVAEHVWCTSFLAILLVPHLSRKVDMERILKIITVHDIVEAEVGDTPFFLSQSPEGKALKKEKEMRAMEKLHSLLGDEVRDLWLEYETRETFEARFCVALDKLEATIQHNNSPISTWTEKDQERVFQIDDVCAVDPLLEELNELVILDAIRKMEAAGIDVAQVKERAFNKK